MVKAINNEKNKHNNEHNDEEDKKLVCRYTSAILKGAALVNETRKLVEYWEPSESLDVFVKRVQDNDLLGKLTAYRTRDIVRRVFAPRLLRPTDKPACILKHILESDRCARAFTEMLFLYACRSDTLVYDFTCREFWPAAQRGKLVLDTDAVLSFLSEAAGDGRLESSWSDKVAVRVARSVLGILRDVGFLCETQRGRKEIVHYRISDEGVALLARDLHEEGYSDAALCEHPDWGLFGLNRGDIIDRLDRLAETGALLVQRAGSVVHITWFVKSIEELIDVLCR